jgi:hypothetical protein
MKKEIHRMEFRLRQLKRKQEEMMQEMELAIEKREIIETKHSVAGAKSKTDTAATIKQKVCEYYRNRYGFSERPGHESAFRFLWIYNCRSFCFSRH